MCSLNHIIWYIVTTVCEHEKQKSKKLFFFMPDPSLIQSAGKNRDFGMLDPHAGKNRQDCAGKNCRIKHFGEYSRVLVLYTLASLAY